MCLTEYLLAWFLCGSISLNGIWIIRDRERKIKLSCWAYVRGQILGLIAGPFTLVIFFMILRLTNV